MGKFRDRSWARFAPAAIVALASFSPGYAAADNWYWDGGTADNDAAGDNASDGGAGQWDALTRNWDTGGATHVAWTSGNTAVFAGAAGTVNLLPADLTNGFTAAGIRLDSFSQTPGYTLSTAYRLQLNGGGLLNASGSNTITGAGIIALGADQSWVTSSYSTLTVDNTIYTNSTSTASPIYNLRVYGGGTLRLTGGTQSNPSNVSGNFLVVQSTTSISGYFNTKSANAALTQFTVGTGGVLNWSATGTQSGAYTVVGDGSTGSGATATLNVTGGALTLSPTTATLIGNNANGLMNVSGGTVTLGTSLPIYLGGNAANAVSGLGTLTVSGSGLFTTAATTGAFRLGSDGTGAGSGVINLNAGGKLFTNRTITRGKSAANGATVNFDGGTLQSAGGQTVLIDAAVQTVVRPGGAVIEATANPITIASNLVAGTGSGGLTKTGPGALTLTGTNTYAGGTAVKAGKLTLGSGTATFGTGAVAVDAGATVGVNSTADVEVKNVITGAGDFEQTNANVTTLSGQNAYTGYTNVNLGVLAFSTPANLGLTRGIVIGNGASPATLRYAGTGHTLDRPILLGGTANMTLDGSGTGGLTVTAAVASQSNSAKTFVLDGTGTGNVLAGALADGTGTYAGVLSLQKNGTGSWAVSGSNTFTGGVTLSSGTLEMGSTDALGSTASTGRITFAGGTLRYSANGTTDYSSRFATTGTQPYSFDTNGQTVSLAFPLAGAGTPLTKSGEGTLVLASSANSPNSYTGTTTVNAGTLQVSNLSASSPVQVFGTGRIAVKLTGSGTFANAVSGTGSVAQLGPGTVSFNGVLSQSGGMTIAGAADLTRANTYTGGTTITAGVVTASKARTLSGMTLLSSSTGLDAVTVTNAGVLAGSGGTGDVVVGGTDTATSGGTITAGNAASNTGTPNTLTTGNQTWRGGFGGRAVVKFQSNTGTAGATTGWDLLKMDTLNLAAVSSTNPFGLVVLKTSAGTFNASANKSFQIAIASRVTLDGSTYLAGGENLTGRFALDTTGLGITNDHFNVTAAPGGGGLMLNYTVQAAPEPATVALFVLGGAPLLTRRRRRT